MKIDIVGLSETHLLNNVDYMTTLSSGDNRTIFSGGYIRRKGTGFILNQKIYHQVKIILPVSERVIAISIHVSPADIFICPILENDDEKKKSFMMKSETLSEKEDPRNSCCDGRLQC